MEQGVPDDDAATPYSQTEFIKTTFSKYSE